MLNLEGCYFWKHRLQAPHLVFLWSILSCPWQIHRAISCTTHSHYLAFVCMFQISNLHLGYSAADELSISYTCFSTLLWCLYVESMSSVRFNQLFPPWHFILSFLSIFHSLLFFWNTSPLILCKEFLPVSLRVSSLSF